MRKRLIPKQRVLDLRKENLVEPLLTESERSRVAEGVRLFNVRRFWDAHEVWEEVWKQREEESRIFFQGIIQAAAGFHLIVEHPRPGGAMKNLAKALEKLELFPNEFLGLDIARLRTAIREALTRLEETREGASGLKQIEIPVLAARKQ